MKPAAMLAVLLLAAVPTPILCTDHGGPCKIIPYCSLYHRTNCIWPGGKPLPASTPHHWLCVGDAFDDDLGYIACTRITPSPEPTR